jgi:hypothetical protein
VARAPTGEYVTNLLGIQAIAARRTGHTQNAGVIAMSQEVSAARQPGPFLGHFTSGFTVLALFPDFF